MAKIQELREQRNVVAREMRKLVNDNPGDKWTAAHAEEFDAQEKRISALDEEIARVERVMALAADEIQAGTIVDKADKLAVDGKNQGAALFSKWVRGGDNALTAEEWQAVRNTMSTTTPGEGGYTVPEETATSVIDALKAFGGMRSVATVITTAGGAPMNWPTSDGTSEEGEILDENEAATDADITFGTLALPVFKFSSKVVTVPIELIQDSGVDVIGFVNGRIVTRLGRITNKKFTIGTGSNEPKGIVVGASSGKVGASGQTATVSYDDLVDLEHSVDPAYRESGNCRWMFADATLKVLKKLKDSELRPLWLPGLSSKEPDSILNYPYTINQSVAAMAANAKSILFGKLSEYVIRDGMGLTLYRFTDSAYAKKGQVGFLAFMRSGGNLMDVGGAVKYYQNPAA